MAAGDGDVPGGDILASADTRAVVLAAGAYPSAGDDDIARRVDSVHVLFRRPAAAADARAVLAALRVDIAAIDIDMAAAPPKASADSGCKPAAAGVYRAGVEVQPLSGASMDGVSRVSRVSPAAGSYARAVLAAGGIDGAAPVVGIALRAKVHIDAVAVHIHVKHRVPDIADRPAPADARRSVAALAGHRGAGACQHIKLPLAAVFLDRRAAVSALQGAVLADEIEISRSLFVQLDGRPLGAGTHLNIYAVNKYVRRGFVSLDEDLLIPCPCVPELVGHGRVDVVAPTVLNGYVRCPVVHVNAHVVLWYGIHRPVRCQYCCRKHGQHHAAQQQDAKYSFLHWLFSSCSCRFGLSAPPFFRFSLILSRKHSAVIATAAAKEMTATST